jgi:hypothetical protein
VRAVRISAAEIERAKDECAKAGVRLVGLEKRPDGSVKFEFGEPDFSNENWFAGGPLYKSAS